MQDVPKWNPSPSCSSTASVKHGNACCKMIFGQYLGKSARRLVNQALHICALLQHLFSKSIYMTVKFRQRPKSPTHVSFGFLHWHCVVRHSDKALWSGTVITSSAVTVRLADFVLLLLLQQIKDHTGYTCRCCSNCFTRSFRWCCTLCAHAQLPFFLVFRTVTTFACQSVTVFFLLCQSGHIYSVITYMHACSSTAITSSIHVALFTFKGSSLHVSCKSKAHVTQEPISVSWAVIRLNPLLDLWSMSW